MGKVFGRKPFGDRLARIMQSPNYKNGAFQNLSPTAMIRDDSNYWNVMRDFTNRPKTVKPAKPLPVQKFDSLKLANGSIAWFGHSSYLLKTEGITLLVDPVFSGNASPVPIFAGAFPYTEHFNVSDLGPIDFVLITHDHYDHLDYKTILQLKKKVKHFYTSLGVGSHLEYWGIPAANITELDWYEQTNITGTISLTATPGRHFSGRGIKRAQTLWSSFVLKTSSKNIFLGGDSGYDTHFKKIGEQYGPFDLAILECGQYGVDWPLIHMTPEQTVQAAQDLKTSTLLPVHWGKFVLANHAWNEPVTRAITAAQGTGLKLITPMIGEIVPMDCDTTGCWWDGLG